jgi:2-dehydro-3-deoxyglucarate aldolase/4-hydroxy-2-oxoheptanedioate aldolase
MKTNPAKHELGRGGLVTGAFLVEFSSLGIPRVLAAAGAQLVIYDQEHTGWSARSLRPLILAAHAARIVPVVRVPATENHLISAVLDAGAMGLMVPMVGSAEQAREIVAASRFAPLGRRGLGPLYPDELDDDIVTTMERINREQLIIAMIETEAGIGQVDEIAAVEGIDMLWIGHYDLTNSLRIPGEFGDPRYREAVDRIFAAARASGKPVGIMASSQEEGRELARRGFRCICFGDLPLYQRAVREAIELTEAETLGVDR